MTDFARLVLASDTTGLRDARGELNRLTRTGAQTEGRVTRSMAAMSGSFSAVAAAARQMALGVGAIFAGGAIVNEISIFESSMSAVGAITRATDEELARLRETARTLGETTEFSAAQAADGLRFLGMAGFTAAEGMQAIPAVLDLATASGLGLAQSADIASNVLSGFGMQAGEAANVADVLASASSRANTSVTQLGGAMSTAAPIAASLGIDLETTAAAIGVMSDAGIQGERAGTALRGVLASLAGPTKQAREALASYGLTAADVNPETNELADIFALLRQRGLSTADAMTIFGREAASGALVLTEGNARLAEFGDELSRVDGAVGEMADTMRDNLGGDIKGLQSALSGLILTLGDSGLTAILRAVTMAFTAAVRGVSSFVSGVSSIVNAAAGFDVAAEAANLLRENTDLVRIAAMGTAAVITGMYLPAIVSATGATAAWIASLVTLRGVLVATGIGALVVAAGTLIDFLLRLRSATGSWGEALSALGDLAAGVWEGIKTSAQSIAPAIGAVWQDVRAAFFTVLESMSLRWGNFLWSLGAAVDQIPGLGAFAEDFRDASDRAIDGMIGLNAEASKAAGAAIRLRNEASSLATQGFDKVAEAAARLSEILSNEADATSAARDEAENLKRAIDEMGTSAGGKAAENLAKASDGLRDFEDGSKRAADRFGDLAASVITGSRSMSDVLSQLGSQLLSSGLSGLFGNIFGGTGIGNLFAGFFDQGGVIPAGQFAIAGERGPEIVTGPARVTSRADTARIMGGGAQRARIEVVARVENGNITQTVRQIAGDVSLQVTGAALEQYDKETLPGSVERVQRDPLRVG